MTELKPCPFCGGDEAEFHTFENDGTCGIHCCICGASTAMYGSAEDAVEAWNRRCSE